MMTVECRSCVDGRFAGIGAWNIGVRARVGVVYVYVYMYV